MRRGYSIRNNFSLSSWKINHTVYIIRRKLRNLRETRWPHNWMAGLWVKKSTFQTELGDCDTHWGKTLLLVHHTPPESIIGYWWTVTKGWRNAWGGGGGRGLMVQNQTTQCATIEPKPNRCYFQSHQHQMSISQQDLEVNRHQHHNQSNGLRQMADCYHLNIRLFKCTKEIIKSWFDWNQTHSRLLPVNWSYI